MLELIAIVVVLWLLGVVGIPWFTIPAFPIFSIMGQEITLQKLIIFTIVAWLATSMGSPFSQILWAFIVLWLLVVLGIITIGSTTTLIVVALLVGLVLSVVQE